MTVTFYPASRRRRSSVLAAEKIGDRLWRDFCILHATTMSTASTAADVSIEPATLEDLSELTDLVMSLMALEADFKPDREKQRYGLRLILEQPNRGRIFVIRSEMEIIGMVNLLFTISTAEGGFVILMEDVIVRPNHRGHGYGTMLVDYVKNFAAQKDFKRITLLTDRVSGESQRFFARNGFFLSSMVPMRLLLEGDPSH